MLATGQRAPREFPSGPTLTPDQMVDGVKTAGGEWAYDAAPHERPASRLNRPRHEGDRR